MFVEIVGRWIAGPVDASPRAAGAPPVQSIARVAQPIDWPRGEDGTISLRLTDELGEPKILSIPTDSVKLSIGFDLSSGSQRDLAAIAGNDPGQYLFAVAASDTREMRGPQVYEVRAVVASGPTTQQVVPPGYFTVTPSLVSS